MVRRISRPLEAKNHHAGPIEVITPLAYQAMLATDLLVLCATGRCRATALLGRYRCDASGRRPSWRLRVGRRIRNCAITDTYRLALSYLMSFLLTSVRVL